MKTTIEFLHIGEFIHTDLLFDTEGTLIRIRDKFKKTKQNAIIYQYERGKKFGQEFINKKDAIKTINLLLRIIRGEIK